MGDRMHTFVVCAYGNSPFLNVCLESLLAQNVGSRVLIVTSTPNEEIRSAAKAYGLEVIVNRRGQGIAQDWNFALQQAKTPLVTLAHQDDVYLPDYTKKVLAAYRKNRDAIILFTDYQELREADSSLEEAEILNHSGVVLRNFEVEQPEYGMEEPDSESESMLFDPKRADSNQDQMWHTAQSRLIRIKHLMLSPLRVPVFRRSIWIRRRVLSLGNPICCPSVTYVRSRIPQKLFAGDMRSNIDWQAWEQLSRRKGSFVYLPEVLMLHRIHSGSTTSELVSDHARRQEDLYMFRKFWPGKIPEWIWRFYGENEKYQ